MRRAVSVWLPDWPITARFRSAGPRPEAPFVLVERTARGLTLTAANPAARALGLRRGQTLADARALAPGLASAPADLEAERAGLMRLALWAERFSPTVEAETGPPGLEGLRLDVTGAARLFGGEAALVADILRRLARAGVPARAALADTPGAAWALARFGGEAAVVVPPGAGRDALAGLPVEALRLDAEAAGLLRRLGLERIGDLYPMPRSGLARRFRGTAGLDLARRLDQALGIEPEPLVPVRPPVVHRADRAFAEPILDAEGVAHVLPDLARALGRGLEREGRGARRLRLEAFRTDGGVAAVEAGLSAPSRDPAHLIRLLKEAGLERLDLGFGADALRLSAPVAEPLAFRQPALPGGDGPGDGAESALAGLIDRLDARRGPGAVRRPHPRESHVPERSEAWRPAGPEAPRPGRGPAAPRPLLLLDPPEPVEVVAEPPDAAPARFVWRRVARRTVRAQGPERLAPEWWRADGARTRDYYLVEDEDGRRFWLFREGLYDRIEGEAGEGAAPRPPVWRMHGLFP